MTDENPTLLHPGSMAARGGDIPGVEPDAEANGGPTDHANLFVIDGAGIDAPVLQLGVALGLLEPVGSGGGYRLNPGWFSDPVTKSGKGLGDHPATLALVLAQLIGQMSGGSLGIPVKEPGSLGTWYPINQSGTDRPSGLHLVTRPDPSDAGAPGEPPTVFGLGVAHTASVEAEAGESGVTLRIWGLIPIIRLGSGGVSVAAGQAAHPFTIGFEVTGENAPLVAVAGFSFKGVRLSLDLAPAADPPVSVSLMVERMTLPGDPVAKDRTLADLRAVGGAELLSTTATLAIAALGKAVGDQPSLSCLLPALGLGTRVPGVSGVTLPLLRWDRFVALAASGGDPAGPFIDWFTALSTDGNVLSGWMRAVAAAIGGPTGPAANLSGSGTRDAPYAVDLLAVDGVGSLTLTAGTQVDPQGVRHFYPGLAFVSTGKALGTSGVALSGRAALEFLDFALAGGGSDGAAGLSAGHFKAGIRLANGTEGEPLFSGTVAGGAYRFGALSGGMEVTTGAGGPLVRPAFRLEDVQTPNGHYPSIDLTQPGTLVDTVESELNSAIGGAFGTLFGLGTDSAAGPALAALLGVAAPTVDGAAWPTALTPPFSMAGLIQMTQDPLAALGGYWAALIRGDVLVGGKPALVHMLRAMGTVLRQSGTETGDDGSDGQVGGSGSAADPWRVALGPVGSPATLLAYVTEPSATAPGRDSTRRLILGIGVATSLPVGGHTLDLALRIEALALDAGTVAGAGIVGARIFPGVGVVATLPQGASGPAVAGASLRVSGGGLSLFWSPYDGWRWSMSATAPTLLVDGIAQSVGTDMTYTDTTGLADLVTRQAETFGAILAGVLGVALYRAERRGGLALDGWLGLLPNLGPFMPAGIDWPAGMPALRPTGFSDPIGQLRHQIRKLLAEDAGACAALGLLGWAIDGTAATAAPIAGTGGPTDPYLVPLGLPWPLMGSLWQDESRTLVVPGLVTRRSVTAGRVRADTTVQLEPLALGWTDGRPTDGAGGPPRLLVRLVLSGVDGPLVPSGPYPVASVTLGLTLALDPSGKTPAATLNPVLSVAKLHEAANGLTAAHVLSTTTPLSQAQSTLLLLMVDAGLTVVATAFKHNDSFQLIYRVLTDLGLAVPATHGLYGIDPAGWQALIASPQTFLAKQLKTLLAAPGARQSLFLAVGKALGFTLPLMPRPLLALLAGLGLVTDAAHGYAADPQAIVAVARDPAGQLHARLVALFANADARSAVVAEMAKGLETVAIGPFTLSMANGRTLTLTLPRGGLTVGAFLDPSLMAQVDLQTGTLTATLDLYVPDAGFSVMTTLSCNATGTAPPQVAVSLTWGDGSVPQPAPIDLWPFDSDIFLTRLAALAPAYALGTFVTGVVDEVLLARQPLARCLFQAFGLAAADPDTGRWRMASPLGLFEDPVGWLLSGAVVGRDGRLDIERLRTVLTGLPTGTAAGLTLGPATDGVVLSGLPYGLQVTATADPASGLFTLAPALARPQDLAAGVRLTGMAFGLTVTADHQPNLDGHVRLTAAIPGLEAPLFLEGGGGSGFHLTIGEEGKGRPILDLVPFGGWKSFLPAVAAQVAQSLLTTLSGTLLDGLEAKGDAALAGFVSGLRAAATALEVDTLIQALIAAQETGSGPTGGALETAALDWLRARLAPANATATAAAVSGLLRPALDGVSSAEGLVTYAPAPNRLPLTILAGARSGGSETDRLVGIWATLSLTTAGNVVVTLTPTGLGIPLAGAATPRFSFGLTARTMIAHDQGPGLTVGYDSGRGGLAVWVDPMMTGGAPSAVAVELLPRVFGITPGDGGGDRLEEALAGWLLDVMTTVLPRYVSEIVLNTQAVGRWLDAPISATLPFTPGGVLTNARLLTEESGRYGLDTPDALRALGVSGFLAGFLSTLAKTPVQVLGFDDGGGIWLEPGPGLGEYGIRFAATGLSLKQTPNLLFHLGAMDTDWITLAGADPAEAKPGIAVYVPVRDGTPDFGAVTLRLVNIGVDFQGKAGRPLVDLGRFQLGAIRPRGLLAFDFAQDAPISRYGGGVDAVNLAIPLAPDSVTGGPRTNAVAQNLLGSGGSGTQANPVANPGFSLRAGWVSGCGLGVDLHDGNSSGGSRIWIPVQRSFGPLHTDRIGMGWDNPTRVASVLFDGSLNLSSLSVELMDLSVSVDVTRITDYSQYSLDLSGLSVKFSSGSVELSGGLYKQSDPLRYDGQIMVKTGTFTLCALGSFALMPVDASDPSRGDAVSFFVFLNLNSPLGGTPAFFVNGLAGGFAINRDIVVPSAADVLSFPLVQGARSSAVFGADPTPASALGLLSQVVRPDVGTYWGAAGLRFSSFEIFDVFALLLLKFGRDTEIDLIGVATATLPPQLPPSEALAYVELSLVASFKLAEGEISVTAQLSPSSFLLARDCRLTGGFALRFWFGDNPHSGDFVVTLGGYHPAFQPPAHYPKVPRLGFRWPVLDSSIASLGINGGSYFALTPSMIMAGASLKAMFTCGPLKAWFNAGADFLIAWQPFHFMADVHVTVGVSFGFEVLGISITVSAELGAGLVLWGPPFAGRVDIDWYVISFSIPFGATDRKDSATRPLSWEEFQQRMLPQPIAGVTANTVAGGNDAVQAVVTLQVADGLLDNGSEFGPAVRPTPFTLGVRSAIPASTIGMAGIDFTATSPEFGIRPMNLPDVTTAIQVTLEVEDDRGVWSTVPVDRPGVTVTAERGGAAAAMWSPQSFDPKGKPSAGFIADAVFGLSFGASSDHLVNALKPMDLLGSFGHEQARALPLPFARTPSPVVPAALPQTGRFATLMATVMADGPATLRAAILQQLEHHAVAVIRDQDLAVLARFADRLFRAAPSLAALGGDLATSARPAPISRRVSAVALPPIAAAPVRSPSLLGTTQAYALPGPAPVLRASGRSTPNGGDAESRSILLPHPRVSARWSDSGQRITSGGPLPTALAADEDGAVSLPMRPGVVAVLDAGSGPGTPRLEIATPSPAGTRVRIYAFDRIGRLLSADAEGGTLPEATQRIALLGHAAPVEDDGPAFGGGATGWNLRSILFQVGPYTLLGGGCTVRPQARSLMRHRQGEVKRGPVDGATLLSSNRIQSGDDATAPGWVETVFEGPVGTVAVVLAALDAEPRAAEAEVQLAATGSPWTVCYDGLATPTRRLTAVDGTILLFDAAALAPAAAGECHAVLVRGVEGLAGVYGFPTAPKAVAEGWADHRLPTLGRAVTPLPTRGRRSGIPVDRTPAVTVRLSRQSEASERR
ncbi:DUF6603 domain-containing protein [Niveispirillum irakense]|uniref:DUF6603 domain-containing protein n=1 Tax=Niveispirillum irakense TaxID=34011 RepID=UPI0012B5B2DA|nr:DUF6603 domain-containing protein [Niveispirillum irakense]